MPVAGRESDRCGLARLVKVVAFVTSVPYCSAFAQTATQATGLVGLDTLNVKTAIEGRFASQIDSGSLHSATELALRREGFVVRAESCSAPSCGTLVIDVMVTSLYTELPKPAIFQVKVYLERGVWLAPSATSPSSVGATWQGRGAFGGAPDGRTASDFVRKEVDAEVAEFLNDLRSAKARRQP